MATHFSVAMHFIDWQCLLSSYSTKCTKYENGEMYTSHRMSEWVRLFLCESIDGSIYVKRIRNVSVIFIMAMRWSFILNLSIVPLLSPFSVCPLSACLHYAWTIFIRFIISFTEGKNLSMMPWAQSFRIENYATDRDRQPDPTKRSKRQY